MSSQSLGSENKAHSMRLIDRSLAALVIQSQKETRRARDSGREQWVVVRPGAPCPRHWPSTAVAAVPRKAASSPSVATMCSAALTSCGNGTPTSIPMSKNNKSEGTSAGLSLGRNRRSNEACGCSAGEETFAYSVHLMS